MAFRRDKALEAAQRYATRGQHDKAAREYLAIVEADPSDLRSSLLLADCLVRAGRTEMAIERYLHVAGYYAEAKQFEKALAVYRQVSNLDGDRVDVFTRCAELYRALRQIPDAIHAYEMAAHGALRRGEVQVAMAQYVNVVELAPDVVAKRLRLAELYSREEMVDAAVEQFGICAELLHEGGLFPQYIRVAERLLFHKDDVDSVLVQLVRVYLETEQPRRALVKLNGLLQRDPSSLAGLELLAETFVALGKRDKAVSVVLELVREHSGRGRGRAGRAAAERVVRRGLDWIPENPDLSAALAQILEVQAEEGEDGIEEISGLVEIDPTETIELDEGDLEPGRGEAGDLTRDDQQALAQVAAHAEDSGLIEPDILGHSNQNGGPGHEYAEVSEIEELDAADLIEEEEPVRRLESPLDSGSGGSRSNSTGQSHLPWPPRALEVEASPMLAEMRAHADGQFEPQRWIDETAALIKYKLYDHARAQISTVIERCGPELAILELRSRLWALTGRDADAQALMLAVASRWLKSEPERAAGLVQSVLDADPHNEDGRLLAERLGSSFQKRSSAAGGRTSALDGDPTSTMEIDPDDADLVEFDDTDLFALEETDAMDVDQSPTHGHDGRVSGASEPDEIPLSLPELEGDELAIPIETVDDRASSSETVLVENRFDIPAPVDQYEDRFGLEGDDESDAIESGVEDRFGLDDDESASTGRFDVTPSEVEVGEPGAIDVLDDAPDHDRPAADSKPLASADTVEAEGIEEIAGVGGPDAEWSLDEAALSGLVDEASPAEGQAAASLDVQTPSDLNSDSALDVALQQALHDDTLGVREEADLGEDLTEIEFYLDQGLTEDARFVYDDLQQRFPGHSALAKLAPRFAVADVPGKAAESNEGDEDGGYVDPLAGLFDDELPDDAAVVASEPTVELNGSTDDEDAYLTSIFGDGAGASSGTDAGDRVDDGGPAATAVRTGSDLGDADAASRYDLGMAYQEMGLLDAAQTEFEFAAQDQGYRAKALVMLAGLLHSRGDRAAALEHLLGAVEAASTADERAQANYELGAIYEAMGDPDRARSYYEHAGPDFRDAGERVARLA